MNSRIRVYLSFICISASFFSSYFILIPASIAGVVISYGNMKEFRNIKFYIMVLIFALIPVFILPPGEAFGVAVSVVLRMIAVYGGFLTLSSNMNFSLFRDRLTPFLGEEFSRSLTLSMNLFPSMRNDLECGWAVMHLNSSRRPRVMSFPKMAVRCAVRNASEISMRLKVREKTLPEIIIVTGGVNSGKTARLKKFVSEEKLAGNPVLGFTAPGVYAGDEKTGFDAADIISGESRPLSRKTWPPEKGERAGWCVVSSDALRWVEELFNEIPSGAILFIDEAGPLELSGGGFCDLIRKAARSEASRIYISSRDKCSQRVAGKFFGQHRVRYL